jgi:hypothetical protein
MPGVRMGVCQVINITVVSAVFESNFFISFYNGLSLVPIVGKAVITICTEAMKVL